MVLSEGMGVLRQRVSLAAVRADVRPSARSDVGGRVGGMAGDSRTGVYTVQ